VDNIKGIILAAGRGSRMAKLTENCPKCLLTLADKSLLQWQLEALKQARINDICIVRGYRADMLQHTKHCYRDNKHWEISNMVRSLCTASDILERHECVIAYSDILYHPDHVNNLIKGHEDIRITYDIDWNDLWQLRFTDPLVDAEPFLQENRRLCHIGGRATSIEDIQGQYMGLLFMRPSGWRRVCRVLNELTSAQLDSLDITALLSLLLERKAVIETIPVKGKWCEVDSSQDLKLYTHLLSQEDKTWSHDWRW
jgi:choline kinase